MGRMSPPSAAAKTCESDVVARSSGVGAPPKAINPVSLQEADALLAKELMQLSVNERNKAIEEVHGVDDPISDEDPEVVQQGLSQMNVEIDKQLQAYGGNDKAVTYREALAQNPSYVQDRGLRLMFLRAEGLDEPSRAADRLLNFFSIKEQLFGKEMLTKDITIEDLGEDARTNMRLGYVTLLPSKDRSGRRIVVAMPNLLNTFKEIKSAAKTIYYVIMACMKDEESQRKGVVIVAYNFGSTITLGNKTSNKKSTPQRIWYNAQTLKSMPFRIVSFHVCYDNALFGNTIGLVMTLVGSKDRIRFRTHFGSHVECQYNLMTFGIPVRVLPVSKAGILTLKYHHEWLDRCAELEAQSTEMIQDDLTSIETSSPIAGAATLPRDSPRLSAAISTGPTLGANDVVVGRGSNKLRHPGNAQYHKLVEELSAKYDQATQFDKRVISELVVHKVKETFGGRFLKKDGKGGFTEITNEEARSKVSHAFRNRRLLAPGSSKASNPASAEDTSAAYPNPNVEMTELTPIGQASILSAMAGWRNGSPVLLLQESENSNTSQQGMGCEGCFDMGCFRPVE